jgi:hypothetical protein
LKVLYSVKIQKLKFSSKACWQCWWQSSLCSNYPEHMQMQHLWQKWSRYGKKWRTISTSVWGKTAIWSMANKLLRQHPCQSILPVNRELSPILNLPDDSMQITQGRHLKKIQCLICSTEWWKSVISLL